MSRWDIPTKTTAISKTLQITDALNFYAPSEEILGESTQDTSPSPDYPSTIKSAGDSNNSISVVSIGKNLFNKNNFNMLKAYMTSDIIKTDSPTSSLNRILYISCNSNTTYTVSKILSVRFRVAYIDTIPAIGSTVSGRIVNDNATSITITTNSTAQYLVVYYMNGNIDTLSEQQIIDSIMIEQASTETEYEPYISNTSSIPLLHPLRSLPNGVTDRIYKENGKWYDEQKIGTITLNGSEAWGISVSLASFYTDLFVDSAKVNGEYITNYFKKIANSTSFTYMNSGETKYNNSTSSTRAAFKYDTYTTVADFKTWLSTHNTEVIYELATPIITEIIDTNTIEALENIRLYSGVTNITSDAPIQITYYEKDKFNIDKYTINDYLTYIDLNNIEKFIKGLSNIHLRNYTKTTWNLGDVITSIAFQNIENELSHYNTLYDLDYTMKNWEIASRNGTQVITYMDINRWLNIIIDVINKL